MDKKYYGGLLNSLEFDKLEEELLKVPAENMEGMLNGLAYDSITDQNNLLVYTYLLSRIAKNETPQIHLLTSRIMGVTLNHIDKAELIGLYHGLRAAELDAENVNISEYLLYFNHIPERVLNDEMAVYFAEKVIKKNPNSLAAKMTLSKVKR
jgi:hypothetical protein